MKKLWMLMVPLVLSACGTYTFQPKAEIGVQVSDAGQTVTVTQNISDQGVTYAVSQATPAEFTFSSRPGSQAAYITSYAVTKRTINGVDATKSGQTEKSGLNIYIPSGFTCPTASSKQSCNPTADGTTPANGVTSDKILIDFAGALSQLAISNKDQYVQTVDLVFRGVSASGQPIEIEAKGVSSNALFITSDTRKTPTTPTTAAVLR